VSGDPTTFEVELTGDEVELVLKAVQISVSHVSRQIRTATGSRLDNLRTEYSALSAAESELQTARDALMMGGE